MKFDVVEITNWVAPDDPGVKILTMPNIPYPTHGLAPRTILGRTAWDVMRKRCYADAGYKCEICGAEGKMHAHELYDIDYENQLVTFKRCVCLCPLCHLRCIHTGRALTLYKHNSPLMTKEALLEGAEHCFKLIHEYNSTHRNSPPLRVFSAWMDYTKEKDLEKPMKELIKKYEISFYYVDKKWYDEDHWGKWRLKIGNKEHPTPYKDQGEWEVAMAKNNETRKGEFQNPFTEDIFKRVEQIIKEGF